MPHLQDATLKDLYGEIRRRKPVESDLRHELGIRDNYAPVDSEAMLKRFALKALAVITVMLIGLVAYLSATEKAIPDLVSGLTGSGIGAIAGLLSSGSRRESATGSSSMP